MALSCKVGSFSSGTGAVSSTVAVTGVGFQPKVVLFWWSGRTESTDTVGGASHRRGFGAASGASSRLVATTQSTDAAASGQTAGAFRTDACIATLSIAATAAIDGLLDMQSLDSDGFTLVVDDVMPVDLRIHYMALGGSDITDVFLGTLTEPGSTGNQDITAVGFQPDAVVFLNCPAQALPSLNNEASRMMLGAAAGASPSNVVWTGGADDALGTMNSVSYCRSGECIATLDAPLSGGITAQAALTTWLSNGFRLNWSSRDAARHYGYVALKGGSYAVGDLLTQTDTTTDIVETLGFEPRGALLLSHAQAQSSAATPQNGDYWSCGAFSDASTERCMGTMDADNVADAIVTTCVEHDNVYVKLNTSGDTIESAMQVLSVESDGFTCEMTDAGAAQNFVAYLAVGSTGALTLSPSAFAGTAGIEAPTVTPGTVSLAPTELGGAAGIQAPSVSLALAPAAQAGVAGIEVPSVAPGPVVLSPGAFAGTATTPEPTLTTLTALAPSEFAGVSGFGSPTITVFLSPSSFAGTSGIEAPTVAPGLVTLAPSAQAGTAGIEEPTVTVAGAISPSELSGVAGIETPVVADEGSSVLVPSAFAGTAGIQQPTVTPGAVTLSPASLVGPAGVQTPLVSLTVLPSAADHAAGIQLPTLSSVVGLGPTAFAGLAGIEEPTVVSAVALAPSAFDGVAGILVPGVGLVLAPTSVVGSAGFLLPVVMLGNPLLSPGPFAGVASFGLPVVALAILPVAAPGNRGTLTAPVRRGALKAPTRRGGLQ